jgi:hypothetical protein
MSGFHLETSGKGRAHWVLNWPLALPDRCGHKQCKSPFSNCQPSNLFMKILTRVPAAFAVFGAMTCLMIGVGNWAAGIETRDPHHEVDREHFRQIWSAIEAYRSDHEGHLPDWLSDLFPKYLTDPEVLLCPAAEQAGRAQLFGNDDPHMRSSYIYEFNALPASGFHVADPTVRATMKDWKTKQMETFGAAVPVVRCLNHQRVLNLAMSGEIYETAIFWETDPNTLALMTRLGVQSPETGVGPEMEIEVLDDATGRAVMDAQVRVLLRGPTGYQPARDWTSDASGRCRVRLPEGTIRELRLEVAHADYVTEMLLWQQEEGLDLPRSHRVVLEPGMTVGGRVEEPAGNPIAGVEVSFLPGHRPLSEAVGVFLASAPIPSVTTDDQGRWRVGGISASLDRANVVFSHPRFRRSRMGTVGREEKGGGEFSMATLAAGTALTVLQPRVEVRIEAVDENTSRPVEIFTVLLAYPSRSGLAWDPHRSLNARDGQVGLRLEEEYDRLPTLLRVQAKGYQPTIRPLLQKPVADQTIRVPLLPLREIEGRVVDSTGRHVAGVSIGLLSELGSLTMDLDGFKAGLGTEVVGSSADGTFCLPDAPDAIGVVAWHETGHGETGLAGFSRNQQLVLSAWGRVEGFLPPGARGEPAVALLAASEHLPRLFPGTIPGMVQYQPEACMAEADANGRFMLDRVPPGRRVLWHPVLVGSEYPPTEHFFSFNGRWLDVKAGETTQVEVSRRSVRGRLQPPAGRQSSSPGMDLLMMQRYGLADQTIGQQIHWPQALAWIRFDPLNDSRAQPFEAMVTFTQDGQFRLEGVPAGRHRVQMRVFQPPQLLGTAELEADIPEAGAPVMLGTSGLIQLVEVETRSVGDPFPGWVGECLSGGQINLSALRGEPVWLHFWTSWSGAGQSSFRALETLLEESGDAASARLVSVNLDMDLSLAQRVLENRTFPGLHTHDGSWMTSILAEASGVRTLPWLVRIGPDGRVQGSAPLNGD